MQASGICDLSDELSDNSDELFKHSRVYGHSGILCSNRVERQTFFFPLKQASSTRPIHLNLLGLPRAWPPSLYSRGWNFAGGRPNRLKASVQQIFAHPLQQE